MKLGKIVVHIDNYNFTKFHQNQMKNKKVLLIARFSVQNFKVSVELWKSYIVVAGHFRKKAMQKSVAWQKSSIYLLNNICFFFRSENGSYNLAKSTIWWAN